MERKQKIEAPRLWTLTAKMCKWRCKAQVQNRRHVIQKSRLQENRLLPSLSKWNFNMFQGFSCLEKYQLNEPSKSKQEHLVCLVLYKVYTRQHKFPFSSVLQTRDRLMSWNFLPCLAPTAKGSHQTLLVWLTRAGQLLLLLGWQIFCYCRTTAKRDLYHQVARETWQNSERMLQNLNMSFSEYW